MNETLGYSVILNLIKFFVTNANIIDSDFSKKFYNFSSAKYTTLYYQAIAFEISVTSLAPLHYRTKTNLYILSTYFTLLVSCYAFFSE
jgi:hypothetical protein